MKNGRCSARLFVDGVILLLDYGVTTPGVPQTATCRPYIWQCKRTVGRSVDESGGCFTLLDAVVTSPRIRVNPGLYCSTSLCKDRRIAGGGGLQPPFPDTFGMEIFVSYQAVKAVAVTAYLVLAAETEEAVSGVTLHWFAVSRPWVGCRPDVWVMTGGTRDQPCFHLATLFVIDRSIEALARAVDLCHRDVSGMGECGHYLVFGDPVPGMTAEAYLFLRKFASGSQLSGPEEIASGCRAMGHVASAADTTLCDRLAQAVALVRDGDRHVMVGADDEPLSSVAGGTKLGVG